MAPKHLTVRRFHCTNCGLEAEIMVDASVPFSDLVKLLPSRWTRKGDRILCSLCAPQLPLFSKEK